MPHERSYIQPTDHKRRTNDHISANDHKRRTTDHISRQPSINAAERSYIHANEHKRRTTDHISRQPIIYTANQSYTYPTPNISSTTKKTRHPRTCLIFILLSCTYTFYSLLTSVTVLLSHAPASPTI